jgi:hypothetical protein
MQIQTHRTLGIIKADMEGWTDDVQQHIEEGANFLLVLPNDRKEIEKFCRLFGLEAGCAPKRLTRSGLIRLGQFIEPEAFAKVVANWSREKLVVFVEQLDFPVNRPPRMQPFLVYSPVLGILAQATTMAQAKDALEDYELSGLPPAEASIYLWQRHGWKLYEGR